MDRSYLFCDPIGTEIQNSKLISKASFLSSNFAPFYSSQYLEDEEKV